MPRVPENLLDLDEDTLAEILDNEGVSRKITGLNHRENRKAFGKGRYPTQHHRGGPPHHDLPTWEGGAQTGIGYRRNT